MSGFGDLNVKDVVSLDYAQGLWLAAGEEIKFLKPGNVAKYRIKAHCFRKVPIKFHHPERTPNSWGIWNNLHQPALD